MRRGPRSRARYWRPANWACAFCWWACPRKSSGSWPSTRSRGLSIEIVPASEVITMTDSPDACFSQEERQFRARGRAAGAPGQADALVSAGNTGAVMAVARFVLGTLPSVQRPALAAPLPDESRWRDGFARRRRERGFEGRAPVAVRGDGRDLLPGDFRNAAAQGGFALDRRRRDPRATSSRGKRTAG